MDIHNFQLGSVFQQNAKEYVTRPVKAMKYQPGLGLENGWMVYFEDNPSNEGKSSHFGVKFFPTKETAQSFIDADCQTAHCGRGKPHFDFGNNISPIVR